MHQCCAEPYDLEFDIEHAQKDLEDYLSKGPKKNSKPLIQLLKSLDLSNQSLLDIGGGVGSVAFELFNEGLNSSVQVDISKAYNHIFREEAARRALSNRTKSVVADFVDCHEIIEAADIVSLDKVICCYQNFEDLVEKSAMKATKWYAFVVPRDVWWVRWGHRIEGMWRKLRGMTFETYVHPISEIDGILRTFGFNLVRYSSQREWYYAIYGKENDHIAQNTNK